MAHFWQIGLSQILGSIGNWKQKPHFKSRSRKTFTVIRPQLEAAEARRTGSTTGAKQWSGWFTAALVQLTQYFCFTASPIMNDLEHFTFEEILFVIEYVVDKNIHFSVKLFRQKPKGSFKVRTSACFRFIISWHQLGTWRLLWDALCTQG